MDFEALLIDDGSTDESGRIADTFAAEDSRFKVFHQRNGGVSAARNCGLSNCLCDWIMFVDGDDWLDRTALESVANHCSTEEAEIYQFGFRKVRASDVLWDCVSQAHLLSPCEFVHSASYFHPIFCYVFRRECIGSIRFHMGLTHSEDQNFELKCLSGASKVRTVPVVIYNYYERPGSAVHQAMRYPVAACQLRAGLDFLQFAVNHAVAPEFYCRPVLKLVWLFCDYLKTMPFGSYSLFKGWTEFCTCYKVMRRLSRVYALKAGFQMTRFFFPLVMIYLRCSWIWSWKRGLLWRRLKRMRFWT